MVVNCGKGLAVGEAAGKDLLEFGNDDDHEDAHDAGGNDEDGAGIEHGGDDLAFDLLGLFHEFGKAAEDDFEHAADFAGFDHVDEEAVENLGVLGEGLGEGAAAFDGGAQFAQDVLEVDVFFLFLQHAQSAQEGQTGLHQGGQLAGEGGEHLGFDPSAQAGDFDLKIEGAAFGAAFFGGLFGGGLGRLAAAFVLDDLGGEEPHVADAADGLVLAGDFEGALGFLAAGVHGDIVEFWHKIRCI